MEATQQTLERPEDVGRTPQGEVRRWILELQLAEKREADWVKSSKKILDKYRQKDAKKNSFNILWSNTETLRPAVYNSQPKPDVRRRFKDEDPVGKAVSNTLARSLEYAVDTYDFDYNIKQDVLDMLLPGRGLSRVRYVPSLAKVGTPTGHDEEAEDKAHESEEGDVEELVWEQVVCEHIQWDDFRIGAGKTWDEVKWVAFRHRLTRDELEEKFGEIGSKVPLDNASDEEVEREQDQAVKELFKTAEVWEIWDKDTRTVKFICMAYKEKPVQELEDPLNLLGFFPVPRPLYAIEDASSLVPVPLYSLYEEQAAELDRISTRINNLVKGLKMRGIYDATLSELAEVMRGEDNDLIPAANVSAFVDRGGLDNAIWFMPIEQTAKVLAELYQQRDACKNVIYEITGIADIIRGASVATETATAQQIKDKWGSMRLKKMQSEVQRYIRDLIRMMAEIIGEKFSLETLQQMTQLPFPTEEQVQQQMMQYQQQAMMAQQQGQQPPPQPKPQITWEQVIQVMKDDAQRTFKIDIETDSTVAASMQDDMQSLGQLLQSISQTMQGLGPAVQMGALPLDALKEILMTVTRRAKMGNAVEDALDKMQQPPPQADPNAGKAQAEQAKIQADMQKHDKELQVRQQEQQANAQVQAQIEQMKQNHAKELEAERIASAERIKVAEIHAKQAELETSREFDRWKAELEANTKIVIAELSAKTSLETSAMSASAKDEVNDVSADGTKTTKSGLSGLVEAMNENMMKLMQAQDEKHEVLVQALTRPKTAILSSGKQVRIE